MRFYKAQSNFDFVLMMVLGTVSSSYASLAAHADALGGKITREAIQERFTSAAVDFLKSCLAFLIRYKTKSLSAVNLSVFSHFCA